MTNHNVRPDKATIFLCVLYPAVVAQFSLFYLWTSWTLDAQVWVTLLFRVAGDAAIAVIPYIFMPRKLRWIELAVLLPVVVSMYANLWYFPYFHDYMTVNIVMNPQLADQTVWSCAKDAMHWKHLWIAAIYIGYVALFLLWNKRISECAFSVKKRGALVAVTTLLAVASVAKSVRNMYVYHGGIASPAGMIGKYFDNYSDGVFYSFASFVDSYSYIGAYARCALMPKLEIELTPEVVSEIERRFPALAAGKPDKGNAAGQTHPDLVFIVAESLNSSVIDRTFVDKDGKVADVMPFLKSLVYDTVTAPRTVAWNNMLSQVGVGGSSDGQFMYNTGLIPLRKVPVASEFGDTPYPSIAKSLPDTFYKWEVIGENENSWNHRATTKSYGYDRLVSGLIESDGKAVAKILEDSLIFDKAAASFREVAAGIPKFMFVTSLGMHTPYLSSEAPEAVKQNPGMTPAEAVYFALCNAFDRGLQRFFNALDETGALDNTVIAVASDHTALDGFLPDSYREDMALFVVYNVPGNGKKGLQGDTVGQIDVYPTILDCMGLYDGTRWKGFGLSLLRGGSSVNVNMTPGKDGNTGFSDTDSDLSEKIIRSGYFNRHPRH